jgi:fused signal recognition particle receptor
MDKKKGFFRRLKDELFKTRKGPISGILSILKSGNITQTTVDNLEETLLLSDVGVIATNKIIDSLRKDLAQSKIRNSEDVLSKITQSMTEILIKSYKPLLLDTLPPYVIMVVGVNGSGKTTTIGKLAHRFSGEGKKVLVAAGDTFRAAAVEQLKKWCDRSKADLISNKDGIPPSAVIYDAVQAAKSKKYDVLIIDTAGRLQTKSNLMEELKKINRIIARDIPGAPPESLLVLDATTGQNAISQVNLFNEAAPLTGIVLTKLDGTAKGGVIFNIVEEMKLPIKLIGFGEKIEDLMDFDPQSFVEGLFENREK